MAGLHAARSGGSPPAALGSAAWFGRILLLVAVPVGVLGLASVAALALVRVGADLRLGLDPFASLRPRLSLYELAARGIANDVLRQVLIALLVLAVARYCDGAAWPRRLALVRPAEPRRPIRRVWMLGLGLILWPAVHIAWVSAVGRVTGASFAQQGLRLSPFLTPPLVAAWLAYVALLAPLAEELLLRGETFARASAVLRPAGTITVTALLFCALHVSQLGLAQPVTLIPLAVALGWLRWRTGRLWPCILLHGWSNLALIAYRLWPNHYGYGMY